VADLNEVKYGDAATFFDYLAKMRVNFSTLGWIWQHFVSAGGKKAGLWMLLLKAVGMFFILLPTSLLNRLLLNLKDSNGDGVNSVLWLIFGAFVCMNLLALLETISWEFLWGGVRVRMDEEMTRLFFDKSIGQYRDSDSFLSASNMQTARGRVWGLVEMLAWSGTGILVYLLLAFCWIWVFSAAAGFFALLMLVLVVVSVIALNRKLLFDVSSIEARFRAEDRRRDDIWDLAERVVSSAMEEEETATLVQRVSGVVRSDRRVWIGHGVKIAVRSLLSSALLYLALRIVSGQILSGELELGVIVPVFVWLTGFVFQLKMLSGVERQLSWDLPVIRAMIETLEQPTLTPVAENPISVDADGPLTIDVEGLSVSYPGKDKPALIDINLHIPAGQSVALVGLSGAGKSTLGDMLMRVRDPDEGCVKYNGVDLRELDLAGFRRIAGHIAQDPRALARTIRENVEYGIPSGELSEYSDERVLAALRAVELDDWSVFPNGLDEHVGRNGTQMSGGQRQRMLIASVLMRQLRVVVIDEATSSLDVLTERKVQAGIDAMIGTDVTAVVISHRMSTLRNCDRIVVLSPPSSLAPGDNQIEFDGSFERAMVESRTFRQFIGLDD